jgi:hypothetical protein
MQETKDGNYWFIMIIVITINQPSTSQRVFPKIFVRFGGSGLFLNGIYRSLRLESSFFIN